MVFPPVPVYLDPPNWQQQLSNQQEAQGVAGNESPQLPPLPPPPPHVSGGATSAASIRQVSMSDRARLAKIPQPEACLKCPRCESTNTKFCYFNNYSLTQPRHFCKTCRRYWTRGGALRNVPVGGGCRRNKKSKSSQSSSSSKASSSNNSTNDGSRISNITSPSSLASNIISHNFPQHHPNPFMTPLHNLTQFHLGNIGLNFSGIGSGQVHDMGFQMGSNSLISNAILSAGGGQQVPFFDPQPPPNTGLFPFQHQSGSIEATPSSTNTRVSDHVASVKMEERQGGLNLSRQLLGVSENSQYWPGGGSTWTDLSGLNSSSSSHLL